MTEPAAAISTTPPNVALAPGNLRIWTKNGNVLRNGGVIPTGDYVAPGTYDASALGMTDSNRTAQLWVEAVSVAGGRVRANDMTIMGGPQLRPPVDRTQGNHARSDG